MVRENLPKECAGDTVVFQDKSNASMITDSNNIPSDQKLSYEKHYLPYCITLPREDCEKFARLKIRCLIAEGHLPLGEYESMKQSYAQETEKSWCHRTTLRLNTLHRYHQLSLFRFDLLNELGKSQNVKSSRIQTLEDLHKSTLIQLLNDLQLANSLSHYVDRDEFSRECNAVLLLTRSVPRPSVIKYIETLELEAKKTKSIRGRPRRQLPPVPQIRIEPFSFKLSYSHIQFRVTNLIQGDTTSTSFERKGDFTKNADHGESDHDISISGNVRISPLLTRNDVKPSNGLHGGVQGRDVASGHNSESETLGVDSYNSTVNQKAAVLSSHEMKVGAGKESNQVTLTSMVSTSRFRVTPGNEFQEIHSSPSMNLGDTKLPDQRLPTVQRNTSVQASYLVYGMSIQKILRSRFNQFHKQKQQKSPKRKRRIPSEPSSREKSAQKSKSDFPKAPLKGQLARAAGKSTLHNKGKTREVTSKSKNSVAKKLKGPNTRNIIPEAAGRKQKYGAVSDIKLKQMCLSRRCFVKLERLNVPVKNL